MKFIVLLILAGASAHGQSASTLKDAYQRTFRIGAALNPAQFEERDARANPIVAAQFNTISPENVLKWGLVHPRADGYNFDPSDHNVAFGAKHQMFIVEHCLVWHSQTPRWVFEDITEFDVDVLPRTTAQNTGDGSATAAGTAQSNPYQAGLPDEMQQKLATRHAELFNVFVQHRKVIGRVYVLGRNRRRLLAQQFPHAATHKLPSAVRPRGQAEARVRCSSGGGKIQMRQS